MRLWVPTALAACAHNLDAADRIAHGGRQDRAGAQNSSEVPLHRPPRSPFCWCREALTGEAVPPKGARRDRIVWRDFLRRESPAKDFGALAEKLGDQEGNSRRLALDMLRELDLTRPG